MSIFALHRTQWVGLDGAPTTNAVSLNTPLNSSNLGLGVSVISDKIGPVHENTVSTDLSYTIPASETFKLSFGIKATANLFDLDVSRLSPETRFKFKTLINSLKYQTGLYLHSDKAYVGVSIPNFIETNRYDNDVKIFKKKRVTI
jgi:type IX secretion system PorP/SprF family membrane protein